VYPGHDVELQFDKSGAPPWISFSKTVQIFLVIANEFEMRRRLT
jgi:hypothetical protein